jgi:hypothetical protein
MLEEAHIKLSSLVSAGKHQQSAMEATPTLVINYYSGFKQNVVPGLRRCPWPLVPRKSFNFLTVSRAESIVQDKLGRHDLRKMVTTIRSVSTIGFAPGRHRNFKKLLQKGTQTCLSFS